MRRRPSRSARTPPTRIETSEPGAVGEEQPRGLALAHVEVPQQDEREVGEDEGPELVDERADEQQADRAREAADDPEWVHRRHGPNVPL